MTITPYVGAGGGRRFCGRCAGDGDLGRGHGREGSTGSDAGRRSRAAEPARRDRVQ